MRSNLAVVSGPIVHDLVARIEAGIVSMRVEDRSRPVHVSVPNHVLGTLLSRALFPQTGYLGIYCELPHELA
jgi:hypothetical protein